MIRRIVLLLLLLCAGPACAAEDVCVVVSSELKTIRRVIVLDTPAQVHSVCTVVDGETLLTADRSVLPDVNAEVLRQTGAVPMESLSAVVSGGVVQSVVRADTKIDKAPPSGELVDAFRGVAPGDTYDAKSGQFVAPTKTITIKKGDQIRSGVTADQDVVLSVGGGVRVSSGRAEDPLVSLPVPVKP